MNFEEELKNLRNEQIEHTIENLKLPKKDRKPFVVTEKRAAQFEKCREARAKNIEARKEMKKVTINEKKNTVEEPKLEAVVPAIPLIAEPKMEKVEKEKQKEEIQEEPEEEDLLLTQAKKKNVRKQVKKEYLVDSSDDEQAYIQYRKERKKKQRQSEIEEVLQKYIHTEEDPIQEERPAPPRLLQTRPRGFHFV